MRHLNKILLFTFLMIGVLLRAEDMPSPPPGGGGGGTGPGAPASPIDMYIYILAVVAFIFIIYFNRKHEKTTV
ncbi:signal peptidase [Kaistella sp. 97-N-M2]|uniref:signal peptidase n=1 Tax=Kaistella sp. 97-N-M2 TaxID=2908645 RepID=UPI001F331055|nr:signal peptidase [Kaistella sp. 97-N-M2]UJF30356.1 signal peptidase [Kaistella sp. 97-N-M2]